MKRMKFALWGTFFILIIFIFINFILGLKSFGPGVSDNYVDIKINDNYFVESSSAHEIHIINKNPIYIDGVVKGLVVPGKVVELNWNKKYIIAKQQLLKNGEPVEEYQYWIIDISSNRVYESLTKEEFQQKQKELDINLKLKNLKKFPNEVEG